MASSALFVCSVALSVARAVLGRNSRPLSASVGDHRTGVPQIRSFLELAPDSFVSTSNSLRVLQFNVLADGLSGLLPDRGNFSRLSNATDELDWEQRRWALLKEVTQYAPDVICLQEVDHFADFFSPELMRLGYMGLHAPKPQSIGTRADGCALFVKTSRLSMLSCSVFTYAIPDPQNQVAVLGLCKVMRGEENEPVHVILATTHLKAAKDLRGERCRCKQAEQLLSRLEQMRNDVAASIGYRPSVIIAGDLNANPHDGDNYPALTYKLITAHSLGLRSVYNDDLFLSKTRQQSSPRSALEAEGLYTTWKARLNGAGTESVTKHCIDYIFYGSCDASPRLVPTSVLDVYHCHELGEALLPSHRYPSDHLAIAADFAII